MQDSIKLRSHVVILISLSPVQLSQAECKLRSMQEGVCVSLYCGRCLSVKYVDIYFFFKCHLHTLMRNINTPCLLRQDTMDKLTMIKDCVLSTTKYTRMQIIVYKNR